jgi:glycosyltransferase involved in cell wall biosynthesis
MRVLIPLDNRGGGGIARVGTELAQALALQIPDGDRLILLGPHADLADPPRTIVLSGRRRSRSRLGGRVEDQLRLLGPARHVDLVHSIDAKAPLLTAAPSSITVHDVVFLDHPHWFPRSVVAYKRMLLSASLRRARLIVCVSDHTQQRLRVHHPDVFQRSRVVTIHSGVSGDLSQTITRNDPADPDEGYFLTVSAIEPRKNHLGLLAAFQSARRSGLRLRWKVVGRPQYEAAAILAQLNADDRVDVIGRVDDAELERLYAGARFVATPSWEEGFGLPPLEAMRRGVPVISSTGSALDETVGEGGLRIDPQATGDWADALLRLQSDDAYVAELSEAGRTQAGRFTWRAAAASYLREFHAIADAPGPYR